MWPSPWLTFRDIWGHSVIRYWMPCTHLIYWTWCIPLNKLWNVKMFLNAPTPHSTHSFLMTAGHWKMWPKVPLRLEVKIAPQPFSQFCGEGNRQCSPNGKYRECRHGNMNREFVSPFPSCWPGQQQTLNLKIRTLSSSTLLVQPNAKTKTVHELELCLLVVPRHLAISPLLIT